MFHEINHPAIGDPPFMETPSGRIMPSIGFCLNPSADSWSLGAWKFVLGQFGSYYETP
jgi:hypothetical protein